VIRSVLGLEQVVSAYGHDGAGHQDRSRAPMWWFGWLDEPQLLGQLRTVLSDERGDRGDRLNRLGQALPRAPPSVSAADPESEAGHGPGGLDGGATDLRIEQQSGGGGGADPRSSTGGEHVRSLSASVLGLAGGLGAPSPNES